MNRILLISLMSIYGTSLYGSFVPCTELVDFLDKGDAARLILDLGGPAETLKKLKEWAGGSFHDFGAFRNAQKVTMLQKFCVEEADDAIIDFLLVECTSNPDFGPDGDTPREIAARRHLISLKAKINKVTVERFVGLFEQWETGAGTLDEITGYFAKYPDSGVDIDACVCRDRQTVRQHLDAMAVDPAKSDAAKKVLAYAAPYQTDKTAALKSLIVGRLELDVPSTLLEDFLRTHTEVEFDNDHFDRMYPQGFEKYVKDACVRDGWKDRVDGVVELLERYVLKLPSRIKRHSFLWVSNRLNDGDEELSYLLVQCAKDAARHDELKAYLSERESLLKLEDIVWEKDMSVAGLFDSLDPLNIPLKDDLMHEIDEHTQRIVHEKKCRDLLQEPRGAKIPEFVEYVKEHALDVDTLIYENTKTIGKFLEKTGAAGKFSAWHINHFDKSLEMYRSNPPEVDTLRTLIAGVLDDSKQINELERFLQDKCFNIDRIVYDPVHSPDTIGKVLDAERPTNDKERAGRKARVASILEMEHIRRYRGMLEDVLCKHLQDALDHTDKYDAFEVVYKAHPLNIDTSTCNWGVMGDRLDELPLKANALRIAKLVQPHRTNNEGMFRTLFKEYENDPAKFADLKEWFLTFVSTLDIDKVTYDLSQPAGDTNTIGYKVTLKNEAPLLELFKATRSKPPVVQTPKSDPGNSDSDKKAQSLLTGKNIAYFLGTVAACYLIYRRSMHQGNEQSEGRAVGRVQEVF